MQVYNTHGVEFQGGQPRMAGIVHKTHLALNTSHPLHMTRTATPPDAERVTEGFAAALGEALRRTEEMDVRSQDLTMKAVYEPDSVNAHEVVLAAEKARFALNLTKTVADGMIRAFKELSNPR
ncbi:MAG: flagellar hook-basal body complex protein FliE [Leptospiraceae bacterium]|nr:flagellar hook-basal body complex protein FliE [Leptospiraceae bacterium]